MRLKFLKRKWGGSPLLGVTPPPPPTCLPCVTGTFSCPDNRFVQHKRNLSPCSLIFGLPLNSFPESCSQTFRGTGDNYILEKSRQVPSLTHVISNIDVFWISLDFSFQQLCLQVEELHAVDVSQFQTAIVNVCSFFFKLGKTKTTQIEKCSGELPRLCGRREKWCV